MPVFQVQTQEIGAGFEHPFDMLAACHERMERTLALLDRLVTHVEAEGSDLQARDAARDVLRYFDIAGPAHHEDEERHVFPALEASGNDKLVALAQRLRDDHQEITRRWVALRPLLAQVMAGDDAPFAELASAVESFRSLQATHLSLENDAAYMPAHTILADEGGEALRKMGDEMARRRGVRRRRYDDPSSGEEGRLTDVDVKAPAPPENR